MTLDDLRLVASDLLARPRVQVEHSKAAIIAALQPQGTT